MSGRLWPEGRWAQRAQEREGDDLTPRSGHGRRIEDDWRKAAPRWFLLLILACACGVIGAMATKLASMTSRETQRIEAALADAPTKYQARLSERVAANEAQLISQAETSRTLAAKVDHLSTTTTELAVQVKRLTDELKTRR